MSTPGEKDKPNSIKTVCDIAVAIIQAIGALGVTLIGVFSDWFRFGGSLVAFGLLGILFWVLTKWTRLGTRQSEFEASIRVERFSPGVRVWAACVGVIAFLVGVGVLLWADWKSRVPADVYVFEQPLVVKDKTTLRRLAGLTVTADGREYRGLSVYDGKDQPHSEELIDFLVTKQEQHRWLVIDAIEATVDTYRRLPKDFTARVFVMEEYLKEGIVYEVALSPPVDGGPVPFTAAFVPEDMKTSYRRVRIDGDLPCNCRVKLRFTQPGIYALTVRLWLVSPSGRKSRLVVKDRELAVVDWAALKVGQPVADPAKQGDPPPVPR